MHKCNYTDRLRMKNGQITRMVNASYQGKKMRNPYRLDVIIQYEDLTEKCRNIIFSRMGGYGIIFPNEKDYYSGSEPYGLDYFGNTENNGKKILPLFCTNETSEKDIKVVLKKYSDFKPVIELLQSRPYGRLNNEELISSLHYWNLNPIDFTFLLQKGKEIVAYDDYYYSLNEEKRSELKTFISDYPTLPNTKTRKLIKVMNLKKIYKDADVNTLYEVNYGKTADKNRILSFFKTTKEWQKLDEVQKEEFEVFLKSLKNYFRYFSYPKFKRIVKDKLKYTKSSFNELFDYEYDFMYTENLKEFICQYNKDFIYTIQKAELCDRFNLSKDLLKKMFELWNKYPREIEGLYSLKLSSLAENESYYEKSGDFKKKSLKLFLKHKNYFAEHPNFSLFQLEKLNSLNMNLLNIGEEEFDYTVKNCRYLEGLSSKQLKYLSSKNIEADEYNDYLNKCRRVKHDMTDPYWLFPTDFEKRSEKLNEEYKNVMKYEEEHKEEVYMNAVQNFIQKNPKVQIDGYEVYIPETIEDIQFQADMLNQCLIRMDYPKKVINEQCILVFLRKNGEPMATCEITNEQIVQFRQKGNQSVSREMDNAMNKWLKNADLKVA